MLCVFDKEQEGQSHWKNKQSGERQVRNERWWGIIVGETIERFGIEDDIVEFPFFLIGSLWLLSLRVDHMGSKSRIERDQ